MQTREIQFYSDGIRLAGSLYLPDGEARGLPGIVACSGYLGLNAIYPRLFAGPLTEAGLAVLGFDYRGTGESDGIAGRILVEEESRDIRDGLSFLGSCEEVDVSRMGLIAWGMGCAAAAPVARRDARVGALVCLNGFYDGPAFLRARHSREDLEELLGRLAEDRRRRVIEGRGEWVEPFTVYPLDPATAEEVDRNLAPVPNFGPPTAFELLDSILDVDALALAPSITCPLLVGHGARNALHPPEQSRDFYRAAPDPKHFLEIDGRHNDFMQAENPVYQQLMGEVCDWLREALG